jgi:hypothetical protein
MLQGSSGIEAAQLGRGTDRVERHAGRAPGCRPRPAGDLATDHNGAQSPLGRVVGGRDPRIAHKGKELILVAAEAMDQGDMGLVGSETRGTQGKQPPLITAGAAMPCLCRLRAVSLFSCRTGRCCCPIEGRNPRDPGLDLPVLRPLLLEGVNLRLNVHRSSSAKVPRSFTAKMHKRIGVA